MFACAAILPAWVVGQLGGLDAFVAAVSGQLTPAQTDLTGGAAGMTALGFLIGMVSIGFGPPGQPHLQNRIMALTDRAALNRARPRARRRADVVCRGARRHVRAGSGRARDRRAAR